MGKGGGGTNTTVEQSQPPAAVLAQYQNVINQANQVAQTPYTTGGFNASNLVAPLSADQQSGYNTIDQSQGVQTPYLNQANNYINASTQPLWNNVQQFSPNAVQQYESPYTQSVLNTTMAAENNQDAIQQQGVVGNAISAGAWGGDRSAVAQAQLAGQQAIANNQTNAGIENQGYTQGLQEFNTQQQAQLGANEANQYLNAQAGFGEANLGTTAQTTALNGATAQINAGAQQQAQQQSELNVPYEQFLAQQAYPFQTTSWLSGISTGVGGSEGGTGTTTSPAPNALSGDIGTAANLGTLGYLGYTANQALPAGYGLMAALSGLKRGGFVPEHYDAGGGIPSFGMQPQDIETGIPNVSVGIVPNAPSIHGMMGPPKAPKQPNNNTANNPQGAIGNLVGLLKMSKPNATSGDPMAGTSMDPEAQTGYAGEFPTAMPESRGGFIPKHYDDGGQVTGGVAPQITNNPMLGGQAQNYANMSIEQLRQLSTRIPQTTPQGQIIQKLIQQKTMMPNVGQQASNGLSPVGQAMADGGTPDDDYLSQLTSSQSQPSSQGFSPSISTPSSGGVNSASGYNITNAPPINKPDPILSILSTLAATGAGKSHFFGVNAGQGAEAGLQNWIGQNQEAAKESVSQGDLQAKAEQLANQADIEGKKLSEEHERNLATNDYQQGLLAARNREISSNTANQLAERQKPIPDGFGGFIIPNPKDPTHPTHVAGPFGGGGNQSNPTSGDSTSIAKPAFGFPVQTMTPVAYKQAVATDAKLKATEDSNYAIGNNANQYLDTIEQNLNNPNFTTGEFAAGARKQVGTWMGNETGDVSSAIDTNANNLIGEMSKLQYVPGMRGSVLGLKTALAGKPSIYEPESTNISNVNSARAKVTDFQLSSELNNAYRMANPLGITDENTQKLDQALKELYPLEKVENGKNTFNKDNVQQIRNAIPDAIANPQKYFDMVKQKQQGSAQQPSQSGGQAGSASGVVPYTDYFK